MFSWSTLPEEEEEEEEDEATAVVVVVVVVAATAEAEEKEELLLAPSTLWETDWAAIATRLLDRSLQKEQCLATATSLA